MIIVTCEENFSLKCWSYDVIFKDRKWLMILLSDIFLCVMVLGTESRYVLKMYSVASIIRARVIPFADYPCAIVSC
jgi:hypothetical protein